MSDMKKLENPKPKRTKYFSGWAQEAADHFDVARATIYRWDDAYNEKLIEWIQKRLEEKIANRGKDKKTIKALMNKLSGGDEDTVPEREEKKIDRVTDLVDKFNKGG